MHVSNSPICNAHRLCLYLHARRNPRRPDQSRCAVTYRLPELRAACASIGGFIAATSIGKAWRKLRATAEVGDLRLHDLRRTVGSWMSQSGTELNTIKHALRHQDLSTTLIYARLRDDNAAHALEEHGKRVERISGRFKPMGKNADY
jgi:integrase